MSTIFFDNNVLKYSIVFPWFSLSIPLSIIWNVYIAKRISFYYRLHRACVEKAKHDPFGNYFEAAGHHMSETVKYTFLLLINIAEFCSMILYALGSLLAQVPKYNNSTYLLDRLTSPNCSNELIHSQVLELRLISTNPLNSILVSTGQAGLILSLAFSICLMKYLHELFHKINTDSFRYIRRFLLVSLLVAVFLLITGSVPQIMVLHKLIEPIAQFIFFSVWIKHTRIFYKTLKWRSFEFRARGNNENFVKRSVNNAHKFALVMWCMGIVYFCLIVGEFIGEYFSLIAIGTYYGPCLFNYLYGTGYYKPLLTTQQQIVTLHLSYVIESCVTTGLIIIAFFVGFQYILVSFVFFGRIVFEKLKFRFGRVRTRFTPSLNRRLLE